MARAARKLTQETDQSAGLPAHEVIYRRLRNLVLFGDLAPGQAVTIQGLAQQLGAGMTPVREAIRRLGAEGALEWRGNRRVVVPLLAPDQADELAFARLALEPELARRAARHCGDEDISAISAIDDDLDAAIARGDVQGYLRENHRFHMAIYARARAPLLMGLVSALWLRFGPSLRVVCGQIGTMNLPDKHDDAITALRARDADATARAIAEDIAQGIEQVRKSLLTPPI